MGFMFVCFLLNFEAMKIIRALYFGNDQIYRDPDYSWDEYIITSPCFSMQTIP